MPPPSAWADGTDPGGGELGYLLAPVNEELLGLYKVPADGSTLGTLALVKLWNETVSRSRLPQAEAREAAGWEGRRSDELSPR